MGCPRTDAHLMVNAILWVARSGASWRGLPAMAHGKQCAAGFCTWRDDGTIEAIFKQLNTEADLDYLGIDATSIGAHQASAGAKKTQLGIK